MQSQAKFPFVTSRGASMVALFTFAVSVGFAQPPVTVKRPEVVRPQVLQDSDSNSQINQAIGTISTGASVKGPKYQFYLDSFQVMDTRSYHEDTVVAGIGVIVNGGRQQTLTHQLGNFNNGNFSFWQKGLGSLDDIVIGPSDNFVFVFQLYNNGAHHQPTSDELEAFIDRDLLNCTRYANCSGVYSMGGPTPTSNSGWSVILPPGKSGAGNGDASFTLIEDVMTGGVFAGVKGIFEGCDGPLAFGVIAGSGAQLNSRIPAQGPLRISADFKGKQLKLGSPCNHSGSHYAVNAIIQRR